MSCTGLLDFPYRKYCCLIKRLNSRQLQVPQKGLARLARCEGFYVTPDMVKMILLFEMVIDQD